MLPKYLHEHEYFRELIEITAGELSINEPILVEKDYWLMHCLYALQKIGLTFELKGGTSLSKGYGVIHRFSEDIDLRINPPENQPLGFELRQGKNHDKPKDRDSRRRYFDWIANFLHNRINGIESIIRDHHFDDEKYRSGGIRLNYATHFQTIPGIKEGILLELGFDRTAPHQARTISSWALDKALTSGIAVIENRAIDVLCYEPKYTFVEKLQAIVRKFRLYQERGYLTENFLRHYYDVYCLLKLQEVQEFVGTQEYNNFKKERFGGDDTKVINSSAFRFNSPSDLRLFQAEFMKTKALYYREAIGFEEILEFIGQYLERL